MKYLLILVLSIAGLSYADNIYEYTNANGILVLSNKPANPYGNKRQQILKEELNKEQAALKETNDLLEQNAKTGNDSQEKMRNSVLQDAIKEHQKNIDILNKQLGYSPK